MKRAVFTLSILVALAFGFAGSQLVSTAQAQTQAAPTVVCRVKFDGLAAQARSEAVQAWMNEQVASGRTQFIVVPTADVASLCAW